MKLVARLAGVVIAFALLAVLVGLFRPESRPAQGGLLVVSLAAGGAASERLLLWMRRGAARRQAARSDGSGRITTEREDKKGF